MSSTEAQQKLIKLTRQALQSKDEKVVIKKIKDLKSTGKPSLLPLLLDLLISTNSEPVKLEILSLLSNLRDEKCVKPLIEFFQKTSINSIPASLLEACWQSRLDFSKNLTVFAHFFIEGDYQTAVETFTVIEEAVWKTTPEERKVCRTFLVESLPKLKEEKNALLHELVKILESGESQNPEEYPELYN